MRRFGFALCVTIALASSAAYAVNEHSEPDEAADRAVILKSEQTGVPVDRSKLNIPNPDHDPENTPGAHTPSVPDRPDRGGPLKP